jgi:hypothetical protein
MHSQALASLGNVKPFGQAFAPQATAFSFPGDYGSLFAIPHDQLLASLRPRAISPDHLSAGVQHAPDFLADYLRDNRFGSAALTPPGGQSAIGAVGRSPATRSPQAIGSVASPAYAPPSPWKPERFHR